MMTTLFFLSLLFVLCRWQKTTDGFLLVSSQQQQQHRRTSSRTTSMIDAVDGQKRSVLPTNIIIEEKESLIGENDDDDDRNKQQQQQQRKTTIHVEFQREIPSSSVSEAKHAWLEFVWKKGGGLPAIVIPTESNKRLILPAFMEEELVDVDVEEGHEISNAATIQYRVSSWPIPDFVPNSHLGIVQFFSTTASNDKNNTTMMVWKAQFDVVERYGVWKFVSEALISQACDNFVAYLRPPLVYTRSTRLYCISSTQPKQESITKWLDFIFDDGGGLPIYKPFILKSHERRMYIPPFMKESIVSVDNDDDDNIHQITYQLDVPAFIGCHDHIGNVQFKRLSDQGESVVEEKDPSSTIDMIWTVKIRPYHNLDGFARGCVSSVVTTLARNFKSHIEEPDVMVSVRPPRGGGGGGGGGDNTFFQVRKDSWLGGVLDAHLRDQRSTWEQTLSLFQPNTWGRSTDNEDDGEGETWTRTQY